MAVFLDTNILLYSVSDATREATKRQIALALIETEQFALSTQVLQEFYYQATRAGAATRLAHADAAGLVQAWSRFHVEPMTTELVNRAIEICDAYRINYWDAAIVAATEAAGMTVLITEDMSHGQKIGEVEIRNPFYSL